MALGGVKGQRRWAKGSVIALLLLVALDWIYPVVWFSMPIHGQVLDVTTGKPIAGAIVAATWAMRAIESNVGVLAVEETTADRDGRFTVPGWGPRFWLTLGHLDSHQPHIWISAPGRAPEQIGNPCCEPEGPNLLVRMRPSVAKLASMPVSVADQTRVLNDLASQLAFTFVSAPCAWNRMPRTIEALEGARRALYAKGGDAPVGMEAARLRCREGSR